jgi:hypothetical protein
MAAALEKKFFINIFIWYSEKSNLFKAEGNIYTILMKIKKWKNGNIK